MKPSTTQLTQILAWMQNVEEMGGDAYAVSNKELNAIGLRAADLDNLTARVYHGHDNYYGYVFLRSEL
jgi:hypothetical protein